MSSINQSNGKKTGSGTNTPTASIAGVSNGQTATQTSPPPNNNAPKYGTLVPNRIFVGGISANTTEGELLQLFSNYGTVKAAKIIQDRAGVSKGYGFITFESEDDAKRLQREAENIVLRERKLNIAPAIKKQPFSRAFDASSPPAVAAGNPAQYYFQPGTIPYFQSGVAYYPPPTAASGDPNTQQPPMYQAPSVYTTQSGPPQTATYPPVMFPAQPIYMPQQYPMPMPYDYNYYTNGGPQYMVGGQGGPQSQVPPMQRPGSPPRPPCYGQQLAYNPETVYYNVPVYGTVEGPAVYQDSLDLANGTIAEGAYALDECVHQALVEHHQHHIPVHVKGGSRDTDMPTTRQTTTPVVSLLSLDQHQEKDFTSMQSGRRRKSNTLSNNNNTSHNFNGYAGGYYDGLNIFPNTRNVYGGNSYNHSSSSSSSYREYNYNKFQSKQPVVTNGGQPWTRKQKNLDTSSPSSRTNSNSSASVADDDKVNVCTPPPPPYSPMESFKYGGGMKIFRPTRKLKCVPVNDNDANNSEPVPSVLNVNKPSVSPLSQVQHFIPPARRNRRSVRRNAQPPLSEIGAGDAPLPNADVSDTCKKLDGLKL